jgi:diguanylate cyclase
MQSDPIPTHGSAPVPLPPQLAPHDGAPHPAPSSNPRPRGPGPAAPAQTSEPGTSALLNAVRARLAQLANPATPNETRSALQQCAAALGQVASSLAAERAGHRSREQELVATRRALAEARVELVSIRTNERRARRDALHDELTRLPNRRFFGEWLGHALVPTDGLPRDLAVFYLDLDGFKRINDAHGHAAGDELLRIVAFRLTHAVRAEDVVSRMCGDEFACALTLPGRDRLGQVARKLFDTVSAPVKIGPHEVAVRPSIGIAICPSDGVSVESLLRHADAAMYHAKRRRSGFAFYDECGAGPVAAAPRTAAL